MQSAVCLFPGCTCCASCLPHSLPRLCSCIGLIGRVFRSVYSKVWIYLPVLRQQRLFAQSLLDSTNSGLVTCFASTMNVVFFFFPNHLLEGEQVWDLHFLGNEKKKKAGLVSSSVCADYCKDLFYQKCLQHCLLNQCFPLFKIFQCASSRMMLNFHFS